MGTSKNFLARNIAFHQNLTWVGGIALLLFVISGICHPLMTWTGPRAAAFFPPQIELKAEDAVVVPGILQNNGINQAAVVKILPSENGAVLQITQEDGERRRYFDLKTKSELPNYDEKHAIWLARYYAGQPDAKIKEVVFQKNFDNAYPWVNRLLPVYRVTFEGSEGLTALVHTETNALGNLTNDWKTLLQGVFRNLHSWSWLENWEFARVTLMTILLLSLFGILFSGISLIVQMSSKRKMSGKRRWHRRIAAMIWIPLLSFVASGTYHLLNDTFSESVAGSRLSKTLSLSPDRFGSELHLADWANRKLNGISIVEGPGQRLYYRLSIPQKMHDVHDHERFKGVPVEKPSLYVDALTGEPSELGERDFALHFASTHRPDLDPSLAQAEVVTQFGLGYDFRNKRLPVWKMRKGPDDPEIFFVDTATGILVDRALAKDRYEQFSFSNLHKWDFIVPLIGRPARDGLAVLVLLLAMGMTGLGFALKRR